jgi:hypothetical protein
LDISFDPGAYRPHSIAQWLPASTRSERERSGDDRCNEQQYVCSITPRVSGVFERTSRRHSLNGCQRARDPSATVLATIATTNSSLQYHAKGFLAF